MKPVACQDLTGRKVITQSKQEIGRLKDVEIDQDSLSLISIIVSPSGLVKKITRADLVISKNNILEISENVIIVDDASIQQDGGTKIGVEDYAPNLDSSQVITSDISDVR